MASCFDGLGILIKFIAASIKTPVIFPSFKMISPPETLVFLSIPAKFIAA